MNRDGLGGVDKKVIHARILSYRSLHSVSPNVSFIFWDIELITLYAILGTQSEGILVLAFERDHWDTP